MTTKVQEPSREIAEMDEDWRMLEALMGGTKAMRLAGVAYLPKWPNEDLQSYETRLKTATLYPALSRTVGVMAGKPFSKALTLGEDVPPKIAEYCDDCDLEGRNLHAFAGEVLAEALSFGLCGVLVDFPETGGANRTMKAEAEMGARPYLVQIKHRQILGWRAERVGGQVRLTMLRLAETSEEPDGDFGMRAVHRVRVLEPGKWALYEMDDKKEYQLVREGVTTLERIPFVPFYGKRLGFMCGASPLMDLAHLNVKHWQSQSDQDTILHVARVPILAVSGLDDADTKWQLTIGSSAAVKLPTGGDMKYVEHTGAAIDAGAKSLTDLEQQMIQTGAELLVQKPGQRSATEANNDAEANKCDLQRIAETHEDGIDQVLQFMAEWIRLPSGGHCTLFKDFGAANLSGASADLIPKLVASGMILPQTGIKELQRRGELSGDIDPDTETDAVSAAGGDLVPSGA